MFPFRPLLSSLRTRDPQTTGIPSLGFRDEHSFLVSNSHLIIMSHVQTEHTFSLNSMCILIPKSKTHPVFPTVLICLEICWTHGLIIFVCIQTFLGGITFLKKEKKKKITIWEHDYKLSSTCRAWTTRSKLTSMQGFMSWFLSFRVFLSIWICVQTDSISSASFHIFLRRTVMTPRDDKWLYDPIINSTEWIIKWHCTDICS